MSPQKCHDAVSTSITSATLLCKEAWHFNRDASAGLMGSSTRVGSIPMPLSFKLAGPNPESPHNRITIRGSGRHMSGFSVYAPRDTLLKIAPQTWLTCHVPALSIKCQVTAAFRSEQLRGCYTPNKTSTILAAEVLASLSSTVFSARPLDQSCSTRLELRASEGWEINHKSFFFSLSLSLIRKP